MKVVKYPDPSAGFPYVAYIPDHIGEHPALLIQLHGSGERGSSGEKLDRVLIHGFPNIVNDENLKDCILILPQCTWDTFWVARIESLKVFIDNMVERYSVDTDRIYLCGLSMGGYGTWYTAMAYPELFAAIAPCCGGGMAWNAYVLRMPIWTFHGKEDTTVSVNQTLEMAAQFHDRENFKCTLYDGVGHNSWKYAFSEELLQWLLSQHK